MAEPSDVLVRLREVPGASPDDDTLRAILAAGRRRRGRRRYAPVAASAVAVAMVAVVALVVRPFGTAGDRPPGGGHQCTPAQLRVTTSAISIGSNPHPFDSATVLIQTRQRCAVSGPFRIEVRAADGTWTPVPQPAQVVGIRHMLATGRQTAATLRLDPPRTYGIDLGWIRKSARCSPRDIRLAGPGLAIPMASLPQWCGQPIAVSNTYSAYVTYSVKWISAVPKGDDLIVTYQGVCRGVRPQVDETARTVTVALVTAVVTGPSGCFAIPLTPVTTRVRLQQPLGDRKLLHAKVGLWPAISR
jgi:hypothetical protein